MRLLYSNQYLRIEEDERFVRISSYGWRDGYHVVLIPKDKEVISNIIEALQVVREGLR